MSHDIGVRVVTWTVNEPVAMVRLLDAGVDAIITDRPDVLREVLVSRDQWEPMASRHEGSPSTGSDEPEPAQSSRNQPRTWASWSM